MSKATVSRETAGTVTVMLPRTLGVRAVGTYRPGVEYRVSPTEARRLIDVKGFVAVGGVAEPDAAAAATTED